MKTAQIGRCGELLVQYELLKLGIESAPMTTDAGIDLVAYSPMRAEAITIQIKTNWQAKHAGGGKGKAALDWTVRDPVPASFVALVDLSSEKVWLFKRDEFAEHAQQHRPGQLHLYMYTDPGVKPRRKGLMRSCEFERFTIFNRASELFGI
jgi:hypothetical protein